MSVLGRPEPAMEPIMDACHKQDAVALRRALEAGGDVNVRETGGWTPIHKVLYRGDNVEMVTMLLKAGIDVNACTIANCTHLHLAVSQGRVDCVAALLAAGASLTVKYGGGTRRLPLDCVTNKHEGFRRILPMLLRAGSDMPSLDRLAYGETDQPFPHVKPFGGSDRQILQNYLRKILLSGPKGRGTFATYEKAHREKLARVFVPKFPQLPPDVIPTIVAYAFHTGWY